MNERYDVVVIGHRPQAQVITSAAAGLMAGAAINMDLVAEDARHAVTMASMRKSA